MLPYGLQIQIKGLCLKCKLFNECNVVNVKYYLTVVAALKSSELKMLFALKNVAMKKTNKIWIFISVFTKQEKFSPKNVTNSSMQFLQSRTSIVKTGRKSCNLRSSGVYGIYIWFSLLHFLVSRLVFTVFSLTFT